MAKLEVDKTNQSSFVKSFWCNSSSWRMLKFLPELVIQPSQIGPYDKHHAGVCDLCSTQITRLSALSTLIILLTVRKFNKLWLWPYLEHQWPWHWHQSPAWRAWHSVTLSRPHDEFYYKTCCHCHHFTVGYVVIYARNDSLIVWFAVLTLCDPWGLYGRPWPLFWRSADFVSGQCHFCQQLPISHHLL